MRYVPDHIFSEGATNVEGSTQRPVDRRLKLCNCEPPERVRRRIELMRGQVTERQPADATLVDVQVPPCWAEFIDDPWQFEFVPCLHNEFQDSAQFESIEAPMRQLRIALLKGETLERARRRLMLMDGSVLREQTPRREGEGPLIDVQIPQCWVEFITHPWGVKNDKQQAGVFQSASAVA